MRFFNTAGPVNPKDHYYVPHRLNELELQQLIDQKKYFILHAPRQSGKTTAMRILVDQLNKSGKYKALYVNIEPAQAARSKVIDGIRTILACFKASIRYYFLSTDSAIQYLEQETNNISLSGNAVYDFLQFWSHNTDKPIILFIDEIDSLVGDTLISVLRQLRAGYPNRPEYFPQSVCLIGVRDVRDYRIWSDEDKSMVLGGSAFNIKAESLTLPNFSLDQVRMLYQQHSNDTGQQFTDEAIQYAFYLTEGQPWLVNALAYQACFKDVTDRSKPITKEIIEHAKETLILRRDTHIDQLIHKLYEPRVRKIIDAILSGQDTPEDFPIDDILYVMDLGLIAKYAKSLTIANPIYQEVIPRELSYATQLTITQQTSWYLNSDGSLNTHKLFEAFTQFYRENSAIWLEKFAYKEAGPHLLLMAFLQRVINGGGKIHREYALGTKRVDLLIEFHKQRIVVELKIKRGEKTIPEGLEQTAHYMDTNNATEGHLIVFDPNPSISWEQKISTQENMVNKQKIIVWCM
jgi:hypothetical protein